MPRIYQSPTMGDAHVLVALVQDRAQADLLVHRVNSWGLAHGPALWYITRRKQDADCYIHLCSLGMAQLRVCFVPTYGEAGWLQPQHRWAARLPGNPKLHTAAGAAVGAAGTGGFAGGGGGKRITGKVCDK